MQLVQQRSGYKQTEVGVIPADWEVKTAGQISNPVRGGSPRPAGDPRFFNGSYIPWLTVAALTNIPDSKLVVSETASCLTEEGSLRSRTLHPGTLIIANSGATLGVAKILGIKCCANDGIAALLNLDKQVSPRYLAQYINTKTEYLRDFVASGNGQPNLNTELIGNFKFPLPPTLAEQEAIATVLSDADGLIESLEQLIAKKRLIKQGAMQELLTGKRRLPGFPNTCGKKQTQIGSVPKDWNVVSLDSISSVTSGKRLPFGYTLSEQETPHPYIRVSDMRFGSISIDEIKYVPKEAYPFIKQYRIFKEDIFISVAGTLGIVGKVPPKLDGANLTENADRITNITCSQGFLLHILLSPLIQKTINLLQTVGAQPKLALTRIRKFSIPLPPTKAEQEEIATCLSDLDAEITVLEAKLAKARQVKQGMMQELLTGRIRLV